jgi:N-acetylmuramoyl-L-alanine amidase
MLQKFHIAKMAAALLLVAAAAGMPPVADASPFLISNRFSPLNKKRPRRPQTLYIVLHTTEGEEKGSLRKVILYGETHYFVSKSGRVYRIIDKSKIAKHAGRSMWEGHSAIDNYSIGIEISGYHNKDIEDAQYDALRELLRQLKGLYHISDKNILTHSMVAYGRPNRFYDDNHRGRKRCGMIFGNPEVRARLGLKSGPVHDADVESGRLKVADKQLFSYLFANRPEPNIVAAGSPPSVSETAALDVPAESTIIDNDRTAWQIARERYDYPSTTYLFPDGSRLKGNEIRDWAHIPAGTRVLFDEENDSQPFEGFLEIGKDGDTAREVAGNSSTSSTTIYFFPDGLIRTGAELNSRRSTRRLLDKPPQGTRVLIGYVYGGYVKTRRPPSTIAGVKWNYPSTYYRTPDGNILSGDDINARDLPAGTLVFYQR